MDNQNSGGSGRKTFIIALLLLALIGSLVFGFWAYRTGQDYKNNADKKAAAAVAAAEVSQKAQLKAQFDAETKKPYRSYKGPATYGGVAFNYPKTWSAYIDETNSSTPVNGYFHPDFVPALQGETDLALRTELVSSSYASVLSQFDSQVKSGKLKASAYLPPKMSGVAGVQPGTKLEGALSSTQNGSMVILKIRDKTLRMSTQSLDYNSDFNDIILASLTFTP